MCYNHISRIEWYQFCSWIVHMNRYRISIFCIYILKSGVFFSLVFNYDPYTVGNSNTIKNIS